MSKSSGLFSKDATSTYPSAAFDALKGRKEKLRATLEKKVENMKGDSGYEKSQKMAPPKRSVRPMRGI